VILVLGLVLGLTVDTVTLFPSRCASCVAYKKIGEELLRELQVQSKLEKELGTKIATMDDHISRTKTSTICSNLCKVFQVQFNYVSGDTGSVKIPVNLLIDIELTTQDESQLYPWRELKEDESTLNLMKHERKKKEVVDKVKLPPIHKENKSLLPASDE
jgi:hypothetical protein